MDIWSGAFEYPKLRQLARRLLVLFRSIYVAESAFYYLKYIKNKYRTRMADENLEASLQICTPGREPNFGWTQGWWFSRLSNTLLGHYFVNTKISHLVKLVFVISLNRTYAAVKLWWNCNAALRAKTFVHPCSMEIFIVILILLNLDHLA